MASILQSLEIVRNKIRETDNKEYNLLEKRKDLVEKLFDKVIYPVAEEFGYDVFVDAARLIKDKYGKNYFRSTASKNAENYPEWNGGDVPNFVWPLDNKNGESLRGELYYQVRAPIMLPLLAKKGRNGRYEYPIKFRYDFEGSYLDTMDPISTFVHGSFRIGPKTSSPKESLSNTIFSYESWVRDLMSQYRKGGSDAALVSYANLLEAVMPSESNKVNIKNAKGRLQIHTEEHPFTEHKIKMYGRGNSLFVQDIMEVPNRLKWLKTTAVYKDNWVQSITTRKV